MNSLAGKPAVSGQEKPRMRGRHPLLDSVARASGCAALALMLVSAPVSAQLRGSDYLPRDILKGPTLKPPGKDPKVRKQPKPKPVEPQAMEPQPIPQAAEPVAVPPQMAAPEAIPYVPPHPEEPRFIWDCKSSAPVCISRISRVPPAQMSGINWEWPATMSMLFAAYGYNVPQAEIVKRAGEVVVSPGADIDSVIRALNRTWADSYGRKFSSRVCSNPPLNCAISKSFDESQIPVVGVQGVAMMAVSLNYDETRDPMYRSMSVLDPVMGSRRSISLVGSMGPDFVLSVSVAPMPASTPLMRITIQSQDCEGW